MSIKFGTSGWRAIIADEFTFSNVRIVSQAIAKYLKSHHLQDKGIIVGYDTRFLSKEFAQSCAETIAGSNIDVYLTEREAPTPVIAYQILKRKTGGAINITASHNPAQYNGIKFSSASGAPAPPEVTSEIEKNIGSAAGSSSGKKGQIEIFDPRPEYLEQIKKLVNFGAIGQAKLKIGVDLLYGTGRGYLDELLREAGCEVISLHDRLDPSFGGLPPEPASLQLAELTKLIESKGLDLGLAVDGDADRFGVVDRDGTYISANQVISLLSAHLIATRPGYKRIARTIATTHMVDALARKEGLRVTETPVGFKYIAEELMKGDCLIGAEESGGLSIAGHIPEKDGILACFLIAEMVAVRKKPPGEILKELYKEVGDFFSAREDFHLQEKAMKNFSNQAKSFSSLSSLGGRKISSFSQRDGYKFIFNDESWLMFRLSGTEPVVRCYCEAKTKAGLKELLKLGEGMVNA
ncbi:MAG: phosphoglucomutase/phosphomannomutase family protein [Candidatus Omnitrophota bacterium]|nr:MAG: phosphoglucomutase/phosphomannomutase family protein [Candidatus Omnitrophota bacterium]